MQFVVAFMLEEQLLVAHALECMRSFCENQDCHRSTYHCLNSASKLMPPNTLRLNSSLLCPRFKTPKKWQHTSKTNKNSNMFHYLANKIEALASILIPFTKISRRHSFQIVFLMAYDSSYLPTLTWIFFFWGTMQFWACAHTSLLNSLWGWQRNKKQQDRSKTEPDRWGYSESNVNYSNTGIW